jgi:outer membrane immunogenic protein
VGGATGANVNHSATHSEYEETPGHPLDITLRNNINYSTSSSIIGGATVGYNWQIPKTAYLIGLEGEYGSINSSGSGQGSASGIGDGIVHTNHQNQTASIGTAYGYGLVGGRLGYALDRSLFYVKSGAVFTSVNHNGYGTVSGADTDENRTSPTHHSGGTKAGYALGAGVEHAPTWFGNKNASIKVEYLYLGINTSNTMSGSDMNSEGTINTISGSTSTSGIHTAKIGVNYKF